MSQGISFNIVVGNFVDGLPEGDCVVYYHEDLKVKLSDFKGFRIAVKFEQGNIVFVYKSLNESYKVEHYCNAEDLKLHPCDIIKCYNGSIDFGGISGIDFGLVKRVEGIDFNENWARREAINTEDGGPHGLGHYIYPDSHTFLEVDWEPPAFNEQVGRGR